MKLDTKDILSKAKPYLAFARRHLVPIMLVMTVGMFGFIIMLIGSLAKIEPTQSEIDEKLSSVVRPKIDSSSAKKIKDLKALNIDIEVVLKQNRSNPFQE